MSNRLDIELTSHRDDGSWTWRVAGARQPRGTAEESVVPTGSKVGDQLTVDAEIDLDGITIVAVLPPKPSRESSARVASGSTIEVLGSRNSGSEGGVTTTLARPLRDRGESSRSRQGGRSRPGREGEGRGRPSQGGEGRGRPGSETEGRNRQGGDRRGGEALRTRDRRPDSSARRAASGERTSDRASERPRSRPERPRSSVPTVHRKALLDSLSPEHRAVADRLVAGGLPAVRAAIDEQNSAAKQAGNPEVPAEPILAMAESLLPRLKAATWCDRADAALAATETIPLRELRTIAASAEEAGRDEPGRSLLARLRQAIDARVAAGRTDWEGQISALMEDGQTVRALRTSSSPPDPGARLPGDLASRLAEAAGKGLTSDTPPPRWILLLEAAAASPVNINVRPDGIPSSVTPELLDKARRLAGRVPALAKLLGIAIPPPPVPLKNRR